MSLLDPTGVVALDASLPERAISSNGDRLGRRDRDPAFQPQAKKAKKKKNRKHRKLARKQRYRMQEAGFAVKDAQGRWSYPPLPSRNT